MSDDTALVGEVKEAYQADLEGWRKNRESHLLCSKFVAGEEHWPDIIRRAREAEQRPCLTVNKLGKFVSNITGQYRLNNMSINISPADSKGDVPLAEVYAGMIRAIQYDSAAQVAYRIALQQAVVGGFGWYRIAREYEDDDGWDQVLKIKPVVNPFSVLIDSRSFMHDLSDAQRLFVVDEIPEEEFKRLYPGEELADLDVMDVTSGRKTWYNQQAKSVQVVEYWKREPYKKGLVLVQMPDGSMHTLEKDKGLEEFLSQTQGQVVNEREVNTTKITMQIVGGMGALSKKIDHPSRYFPIIPVYGEDVVYDGQRHLSGIVKHMIDPQKIYNFQWTAAVETVALQPRAPYLLTPKQINNGEHDLTVYWDNINRGTPYALYNPDSNASAPQRQMPPTVPTGMLELCDRATADLMETSGIYQANLGERGNERSGRAILARQAQGDVATATYPDNLRWSQEHCGRVLIDMIPRVYDTPRMVRILGEDLQTAQMVDVDFTHPDVARGRYDVLVKVGPSFDSRRQEAFNSIMEFAKSMPPQGIMATLPVMLKYSDWPGASEIAQALQQAMQAQTPQKAPSESLNYKDAPPDIQRQIEAQAGLQPSQMVQAGAPGQTAGPPPDAGAPPLPGQNVPGHGGAPPPNAVAPHHDLEGIPPEIMARMMGRPM